MIPHRQTTQNRSNFFLMFLGIIVLGITLVGCGGPAEPTASSTDSTASQLPTDTEALPSPSPSATLPPPTITATETLIPTPTNTPEPTPTLTPTPLPAEITDDHGVPMILIPGGAFVMGSDNNQAAAKPAHSVYLDDFYIDKFEVTNEMYRECAEAGVCTTGGSSRINNDTWVGHPVMDVTWYEAHNYCEWRSGRLPTEAEWEKAARGTDERKFPWGNEPVTCELARYGKCGWFTILVGQHPEGVSPYGVHDMAGNAWEWTQDWYKQDYYAYSPTENPTGPAEDTGWKSTRGGAWFYQAGLMTSIWRNHAPPTAAYSYLGFRCVVEP
ncbi:MAG: formylglycine-generating enzyme family protein [Chloroflexota bacterium]|nr:formylglycine-generating enzyme family protein [Chloroflexota bacterium]